jgi:hypothetical protein
LEADKEKKEKKKKRQKESIGIYVEGALLGGLPTIPLFVIYDAAGLNKISFIGGFIVCALYGLAISIFLRDNDYL